MLILDPERGEPSPRDRLEDLFGLTRAEARVAAGLLDGQSPNQIAAALGVSVHTVRSQVRAILGKSGTSSQLQFVSLAFRTLGRLLH